MKKILAILLAVVLIFSLAACGKNNEASSSAPVGTDFVKPENYAVALLVSINPQFTIYLDVTGEVLAVDFLNEDAKAIEADVSVSNVTIDDVIKNIISAAQQHGYFATDPKIDIKVIDSKIAGNELDALLNRASSSATDAGQSFGLKVELNKDGASDADGSTTTTAGAGTTTAPNHTHSFSKANCTSPAKCACGATNGAALGHSWQEATCVAPKTCKVCGATEGEKASHNYVNGKCSVCGDSMYLNPKTNLKLDEEYLGNFAPKNEPAGRMLYGWGLFTSSSPDGNILYTRCYSATNDGGRRITFKGEDFYSAGGGPNVMSNITITDTEIIAGTSFSDDTPYVKFAMLKNGRLIVTYSLDENYPVGMQLSCDPNEFLMVD